MIFVSFSLIQKFITYTWAKSTNHLHYLGVIHLIDSLSTAQRWQNVQKTKGESKERKYVVLAQLTIVTLPRKKHRMTNHCGTFIQPKNSWKMTLGTNLQMTHSEYQAFDLQTSGKHVYAEAAKQLDMAYRQLQRILKKQVGKGTENESKRNHTVGYTIKRLQQKQFKGAWYLSETYSVLHVFIWTIV